jgi:hypothetical protein
VLFERSMLVDYETSQAGSYLDRPPIARAARLRRGLRRAVALVAATTALGSGAALAADPPTILTAGIDAGDHLYVTWSLAEGTTYTSAGFASGPWPEPGLPFSFFAGNSAGDSDCARAPRITDRARARRPPRRSRRPGGPRAIGGTSSRSRPSPPPGRPM